MKSANQKLLVSDIRSGAKQKVTAKSRLKKSSTSTQAHQPDVSDAAIFQREAGSTNLNLSLDQSLTHSDFSKKKHLVKESGKSTYQFYR